MRPGSRSSLALLAAAVHVGWVLPRLTGPAAWAVTAALLALGAVAVALTAAWWPAVAMAAVLFGHVGHALGVSRRPGAANAAPCRRHAPEAVLPSPPPPRRPRRRPRRKPLPATLGRYRIDSEIGRGSMGAVYLGRDPQIGRQVAIKTLALSREFEGEKLVEARKRFFREAETAGRLQHPDIVTIFDAGEAQDLAYIAMEYIKGHDLQRYTASGRLLPVPQVLEIVARVAEALCVCARAGRGAPRHQAGQRDGRPGQRPGEGHRLRRRAHRPTPAARAPASCSARPRSCRPSRWPVAASTAARDLYSLGVMLFQLLTGALPHQDDSMARLMQQIANEPAPDIRTLRPELPQELADVVALALEKRPEVRYADGVQMAHDLRAIAAAMLPHPPRRRAAEPDEFEKTVTFSRVEPRHNSEP